MTPDEGFTGLNAPEAVALERRFGDANTDTLDRRVFIFHTHLGCYPTHWLRKLYVFIVTFNQLLISARDMKRRHVLQSGVISLFALLAGCTGASSSAAEVSITNGQIKRDGDVFSISLDLRRAGSSGDYEISLRISDESGNIIRRRISGELTEDTTEWTETTSIDLRDIEGVDEMGANYTATAAVVTGTDESEPTELSKQ